MPPEPHVIKIIRGAHTDLEWPEYDLLGTLNQSVMRSIMTTWQSSKNYIICTTARSGSNLFCDFLKNTKSLGRPIEAFNPDIVRKSAFYNAKINQDSVPVSNYISWMLEKHRTPNGIFGTKLLFEDFDVFRGFPSFVSLFNSSYTIHLRRRSKLRQAISYYFAEMTGQWISTDVARMDPTEVPFDYDEINRHMRRLILQDATWTSILQGLGCPYIEVYFEDFVSLPAKIITSILAEFGEDRQEVPIVATLKEQRNARTDDFVVLFEEELTRRLFQTQESQQYKGSMFFD